MKELSIGDIDIIGGKIVRCEETDDCSICCLCGTKLCLEFACQFYQRPLGDSAHATEVSLSSLTAEREQICKACKQGIDPCDQNGCADTEDIDRQIAKVKELMKCM